jgi:membrane fusion protein, multidrug efflux system
MTHHFSTHTRVADLKQQRRRAALTLVATLLLGSLTACSRAGEAQPQSVATTAVPVRVAPLGGVQPALAGSMTVTGTLSGKEEVALAFKVGGVISRVAVDPGQTVRAGQVLAELRPTEIAAQVANAREGKQKAERDLARVTKLYADSVATLEQLQDARTGLQLAENAVRMAQFNADYAVIRAPGDGVVLARMAEPGQVVAPGAPVLTVRRSGRGMIIRVGLPDRDAVRVTLGDRATVRFDAVPGREFAARVTQRAAAATPGSGDYAVELTLSESASTLPSGLVAHVTLQSATPSRAAASTHITVPLDALVDADGDSAAVFVLRADRKSVSRRAIKLADIPGALQTAQVTVVTGLDGSETVVVAGMSRLIDGTAVSVVTSPTARNAADTSPVWKSAR